MGGIYEAFRLHGLKCHDIHTKFLKNYFRNSKVDWGADTDTQKTLCSHKPTFIFPKQGN
jgi:hypothetical protein